MIRIVKLSLLMVLLQIHPLFAQWDPQKILEQLEILNGYLASLNDGVNRTETLLEKEIPGFVADVHNTSQLLPSFNASWVESNRLVNYYGPKVEWWLSAPGLLAGGALIGSTFAISNLIISQLYRCAYERCTGHNMYHYQRLQSNV